MGQDQDMNYSSLFSSEYLATDSSSLQKLSHCILAAEAASSQLAPQLYLLATVSE